MSLVLDSSLKNYAYSEELKDQIEKSKYILKTEIDVTLSYQENILKLNSMAFPDVYCDFLNEKFLKEVRQSFGRSEGVFCFLKPLAKNTKLKICDLTVGMGKDLFKFVLAGHDVVGFERNPIFYHLVLNGMERFKESKKLEDLKQIFKVDEFKVSVRLGEAAPCGEFYDLAYFDPMFSDVSKKAAPKKGMQALKTFALPSLDEEKENVFKIWKKHSKNLVYKCSGKTKNFPLKVLKKIKGKGFFYFIF